MRALTLFLFWCSIGYTTTAQNLLTLNGDTLNIREQKVKTLYILLDNRPCTGCVDFLGKHLKASNPRVPIVIITTIPNGDLIYKKQYVASIKKKFTNSVEILTDINNNLFEEYHVEHTPSLLFFENGLFEHVPYEEIFDNVFVKPSMKKKIKQFIKKTNVVE